MKAITWLATIGIATAIAVFVVSNTAAAATEGWSTDYDEALEQAKEDDKAVLVEFTGSDWCPPCKLMHKKVFSKKNFVEAASKDFILVKLDFPRSDKQLAEKNEPFAKKHKVQGFPTVVLLDSSGKEFSRTVGAEHQSVSGFLAYLEKALERKDLD